MPTVDLGRKSFRLYLHISAKLRVVSDRAPHRPAMNNNPIEGLEGLPDAQKNALMTQIEEMQVRDR